MHIKQTISFCPTCYKRIPADIYSESGKVWMKKNCSEHGTTSAIVENNESFYIGCQQADRRPWYPGYFLDVTSRCNLSCRHCYYAKNNQSKDPSIDRLLQEAQVYGGQNPIILIGGEPTLRDDLIELVSRLYNFNKKISLVTNGIELPRFINELQKYVCWNGNVTTIELSIHKESRGKDIEALKMMGDMGLKVDSVLFMIESLEDLDSAIDVCEEYRNAIHTARLRCPSKVWDTKGCADQIFVSDMLEYLMDKYSVMVRWWDDNKSCFFNIDINGIHYILGSWGNVYNIDLMREANPPFYMSNCGSIEGVLAAFIVNEGMEKGWLNGRRFMES